MLTNSTQTSPFKPRKRFGRYEKQKKNSIIYSMVDRPSNDKTHKFPK